MAPSDPRAEPGFLGTEPASLPLSSARCQNSPGLTPLLLLDLVLQDGAEQGQSPAGHTQPWQRRAAPEPPAAEFLASRLCAGSVACLARCAHTTPGSDVLANERGELTTAEEE